MQISFYSDALGKYIMNAGKLNVIYGHSGSGKTQILNLLNDGFSAKSKNSFRVDGMEVQKSNFEILFFDAKQDFSNQIKMDSKSLFRKIVFELINSQVEDLALNGRDFVREFNQFFNDIKTPIDTWIKSLTSISSDGSLNYKIEIESINDILTNIFTILMGDEASGSSQSYSKLLLYSLVIEYIKKYPKNYIVLIDNFDADLDEENTLLLLDHLIEHLDLNATFILTTNKNTSFQYTFNRCKTFCLRKNKIFDFSKLFNFYKLSQVEDGNKENFSYEDYIVNSPYIDQETMQRDFQEISLFMAYSIGRLLTNRNVTLQDNTLAMSKGVTIVTNNHHEMQFYRYVQNLITQ